MSDKINSGRAVYRVDVYNIKGNSWSSSEVRISSHSLFERPPCPKRLLPGSSQRGLPCEGMLVTSARRGAVRTLACIS